MSKHSRSGAAEQNQGGLTPPAAIASCGLCTDTQTQGGIIALRGFRKQFLHSLKRIITSNTEVFYPEGIEDLDVYDSENCLLELVQVKDYKNPLVASELGTFFSRAANIAQNHPDIRITLASYGDLGEELKEVVGVSADKLKNHKKFSTPEMLCVLPRLRFHKLDETAELQAIEDFLANHPMLSGDGQTAFGLLMQDLYRGAEDRKGFSRQSVTERLQQIGRYLTEREAHHREWNASIIPLEDTETENRSIEQLREAFREGVTAQWSHITADLDIERQAHLQAIESGFKSSNMVIVHGASGQGKSALAYRYLHDYCPAAARYEIRDLTTEKRALEVITAITGYKVPLTFYVDASHKDKGLPEFLRRIAENPYARCLVTIREEDWRLSGLTSADFKFSDIELNFGREEAEALYRAWETSKDSRFPDFEQAWTKFNESGPLLEFVHLLTYSETLHARLRQQYEHIADAVDRNERSEYDLRLLEYIAVSGACGARIDLTKLTGTPSLKRSIERLEKEYLLRRSDDQRYLLALHPIRAEVLTSILTDSVISPWVSMAKTCLPLVADTDMEMFLLHGFVSHPEASETMLAELCTMKPDSWVTAGGIVNALLWKGVHDYVWQNKALIEDAYALVGDGFWAILDIDVAGLMDSGEKPYHKIVSELCVTLSKDISPIYVEKKHRIESLQTRQINKDHVFNKLDAWLQRGYLPESPCSTKPEWQAFAQIAYWAKFRRRDLNLLDRVDLHSLTSMIQTLPLECLADVVYGLWKAFSGMEKFSRWYADIRPKLLERYRVETQTPYIEEQDTVLRVHFILPLEENEKETEDKQKYAVHESTMQHVTLLARLSPEFDAYGCQGYGHQVFDFMTHDDSTKTAIPAWQFTPDWATEVNRTVRILASRFFGLSTWNAYCASLRELRENTVQCMDDLRKNLEKHFRSKMVNQQLSTLSDSNQWQQTSIKISKIPKLPLEAFDQWGYVEEGDFSRVPQSPSKTNQQISKIKDNLKRYAFYTRSKQSFFGGLSNFINQAPPFMIVHSFLGKAKTPQKRLAVQKQAETSKLNIEHPHVTLYNLFNALKALPTFQQLYRRHFSTLSNRKALSSLEQQETQTLRAVWALWFFFVSEPERHWNAPEKTVLAQLDGRMRTIRKNLERTLRKHCTDMLQFHCLGDAWPFEDKAALWISIAGDNPLDVYTQTESVIEQLKKAVGPIKLHSLDYYALHFQWETLVIVPVCKGKLLDAHVWSIPTYRLETNQDQDSTISLIDQVLRQIDVTQLSQLGLKIWPSGLLQDAPLFLRSTATLQVRLRHLVELSKLPNLDDTGSAILRDYVNSTQDAISKEAEQMYDAGVKLQALAQEHANEDMNGYLLQASKCLSNIGNTLLPDNLENNQAALTTEALKTWQQRLALVQGKIFVIYLLWCGYLLSKT